MRNALLTIAIVFCLATASRAAGQKKSAQLQPKQSQQNQMARKDSDGSMEYASSATSGCTPTSGKQLKPNPADPEGDPQAAQNQVEYGGAG